MASAMATSSRSPKKLSQRDPNQEISKKINEKSRTKMAPFSAKNGSKIRAGPTFEFTNQLGRLFWVRMLFEMLKRLDFEQFWSRKRCFSIIPRRGGPLWSSLRCDRNHPPAWGTTLAFLKVSENFCQTFVKLLSNFCQTFVKLLSNFCQTVVKLLSNFCQTFVKLLSNCCQTFVKLLSNFCQTFVMPGEPAGPRWGNRSAGTGGTARPHYLNAFLLQ